MNPLDKQLRGLLGLCMPDEFGKLEVEGCRTRRSQSVRTLAGLACLTSRLTMCAMRECLACQEAPVEESVVTWMPQA
ncbi:hypothetical protein PGT21_026807 [Puccinia graminis f. sp. tritici]|uniref:Uncharacterized protein n=1 Tax=Puccinia graminis f. sp. tritici TaxID=56615 RepID=A0A5B0PUE9_PUCGR|nr:hypothetical protein PGTUg99_011347 [Puccinia graminis f. sp. tritici]KAA1104556.1 hypothetical protein PGT21_026807 [Puccinia graminis f. sp. tritici]